MKRRTFVMSGLGPLVLAACGGGDDDAPLAATENATTLADGRESAAGYAIEREAFMFLEPVNGTESTGLAVNSRGQVTGWSGAGEAADIGTTLWSRGNARRFPTLGGFGSGSGASINEAGQIVGHSTLSATESHATLWIGGRPIDLGSLNGALASGATSINTAGDIVGWSYIGPETPTPTHAILWHAGEMIDLGTLGGSVSGATDINNAGVIVGWSAADQVTGLHAALWRNGAVIDLGGLGGTVNYAYAINDAGLIVGSSSLPDPQSGLRAVQWSGGTLTELATLGGDRTIARDVNNAGQIVGWSSYASDPNGHAILWDGNAAIDLNRYLDGATRNAGWYLASAIGISDSGRVTGDAYNRVTGARRAYLLSLQRRHH